MEGSYRQVYGRGSTASSRAVLSEHFLDENEIEEQMFKMNLGEAVPLSSGGNAKPVYNAASTTQKSKVVQSNPVSIRFSHPLLPSCSC